MKVRPAVFFPLCVLALAGAFGAGYAVRGTTESQRVVDEGAKASKVAVRSGSPGRAGGEVLPFTKGRAEEWVREIDKMAEGLNGQRMRIYAAQQCAMLSEAEAVELLAHCESYHGPVREFDSKWSPRDELLDEIMRDTIARLSDLNPGRAIEVAADSVFLNDDREAVATCLEPLISRDPAKVAEFLAADTCDREALIKRMEETTDLGEHPECVRQYLPACRDDPGALGILLDLYAGRDRDEAFGRIASELSKADDPSDKDFWSGAAKMSFSQRSAFAEWSAGYSGPQAERVQACALESLIPDASEFLYARRPAELFEKLLAGQPSESRGGFAESFGQHMADGNLGVAAESLDRMEDAEVKQNVLTGICRARLDELAKDPEESLGEENRQPGYWIAKVESAGERDTLTVEYVRTLERGGRAEADQWAESISDPALKQATKQMLAQGREVKRLTEGK